MHIRASIIPARRARSRRRRGFTIRELAVVATCTLVAAGLVASLAGANRSLSQASVCTANLETLFGGLTAYVDAYNSYPPHNPYPRWVSGSNTATKGAYTDASGIDPNIGWILTYGLALPPPATYMNDRGSPHFKWYVLQPNELPSVCVCPAANQGLLFTANPEIDPGNSESFVYQYAAFYQTSGTCRSETPLRVRYINGTTTGGRNLAIPDPSGGNDPGTARPADNAQCGVPHVCVCNKTGDPTNPSQSGNQIQCYVQAIRPDEVQDPRRIYYLADSREYRPQVGMFPGAAISDGWLAVGNKILLGTRHYGFSNVLYLDGQANRDNQAHPVEAWNMSYNGTPGSGTSSQWRCATFADDIALAQIRTQHHIMPVLNVKGWEYFFNNNGLVPR